MADYAEMLLYCYLSSVLYTCTHFLYTSLKILLSLFLTRFQL
jgi:hypothetical protein